MEAAKRDRDIAAKELTDAIRQADKYINAPNPNTRLLKQRITRIEERETHFRECHYLYLDKAKLSYDDDNENIYLTELTDKALDCTDKCLECIVEESNVTVGTPARTPSSQYWLYFSSNFYS